MTKKFIRKRKTPKEVPYEKQWAKLKHVYGGKDNIPFNTKERVKKYFRGHGKDPFA